MTRCNPHRPEPNRRRSRGRRFHGWPLLFFLALSAGILLSGCAAVGPDYQPPPAEAPEQWQSPMAGGLSAAPAEPETLARWWTVLGDPVLDQLVERAAAANLDLREAAARVREARAIRGIRAADLAPTADAGAAVTNVRESENSGLGRERTYYQVGFDAGWELDLFGGLRRRVEAAQADLEASQENRNAVLVTLLGETAFNYVEARAFQARIKVAEANIQTQQRTHDLIRSRYQAGLSDELALQQARYNLESTRSRIPGLKTGLQAVQNRLAVLLGLPPGSIEERLGESGSIPVPPLAIAVGVPAETLRRRPDVRAAERDLAAETARIGAAVADLYPKFRLDGFIGLESISSGDLLTSASRLWSVGPSVGWRIFDGGAIRNQIEAQTARQEQALIRYEATLLKALEEVENALSAFAQEQLRRDSLEQATAAAQRAAILADDRYQAGLVDFSNVLDAQRSLLSFQDQLESSRGAVTADLVRIYKALGGGWGAGS